eukprot:Hpha_TRINITY_DN17003_c2_g3::TRINITY_DN17003_c2_g3_i1::g.166104::m.166104
MTGVPACLTAAQFRFVPDEPRTLIPGAVRVASVHSKKAPYILRKAKLLVDPDFDKSHMHLDGGTELVEVRELVHHDRLRIVYHNKRYVNPDGSGSNQLEGTVHGRSGQLAQRMGSWVGNLTDPEIIARRYKELVWRLATGAHVVMDRTGCLFACLDLLRDAAGWLDHTGSFIQTPSEMQQAVLDSHYPPMSDI